MEFDVSEYKSFVEKETEMEKFINEKIIFGNSF